MWEQILDSESAAEYQIVRPMYISINDGLAGSSQNYAYRVKHQNMRT